MKPDIKTVRIEKRPNRAQILAFAFQESLEEDLFCRSPVINEVVLGTSVNKGVRKGWEDRFGTPMGVELGLPDVLARGLACGVVEAATPGLHERKRDGVRRAAVGTSQVDG
jgi:hypothetical protein